MTESRTPSRPSPDLVAKVLTVLDRSATADAAAIAREILVSEDEVRTVLDDVADYRRRVAAEQARHRAAEGHAEALPPGTVLGDFVLDGILGRGAMGVVYRARQTSLGNREVALKVLPTELVAKGPRFVERFRREASLAADIHHPNIAEVYGFVELDGVLCFAMRLVEGRTLRDILLGLSRRHRGPQRPSSLVHARRSVLLVRGLADALAEIHANGLVHRDVKPANIILERASTNDEDALTAQPVLVDFGLLRPTGASELTGTNTLLGTPAYASPESQLGHELDVRADVFSLGATLHDLLTLTSPGTRGPATAGLPEVHAVNPTVDRRLAAIVDMALQERRALRYENAGALRDELDRYLRDEPLRALPTRTLGRLSLWARRNPVSAVKARTAAIAAMLGVLVAVVWLFVTAASLLDAGN